MHLLTFTRNGKLLNDDAYSVPEFKEVLEMDQGDKLFYAVALTVDYKSVFRKYQEGERYKAVLKRIFGSTQPKGIAHSSSKVDRARKAYMTLQYDDLEEDLRIVRKKVNEINNILDATPITMENYKISQEMLLSKDKYIKQREYIEKAIEKRGELIDLKLGDDIVLSRLEQKLVNDKALG